MIQYIDKSSIHKICSGQVVVDLATAVKELVENAMDAGATSIEVKLKEMGVEYIEVIDNGCGINPENFNSIALKHHTSKLKDFEDLKSVRSFGFRGEALNALCEISGALSVTTKQEHQSFGSNLQFGRDGQLISNEAVARGIGTTVRVDKLFQALPVRRSEFERNVKRQYQRMVKILQSYAVIAVGVNINVNNISKSSRQSVISTQRSVHMEDNISSVFGAKFLATLMPFHTEVIIDNIDIIGNMDSKDNKADCRNISEAHTTSDSFSLHNNNDNNDKGNHNHSHSHNGDYLNSSCTDLEDSPTSVCTLPLSSTTGYNPTYTSHSSTTSTDDGSINSGNSEATPSKSAAGMVTVAGTTAVTTAGTTAVTTAVTVVMSGFVSKVGLGVGRCDNERQFVFLNNRPIDSLKITKAVNEKPAFIVHLTVPPGYYDINLTPDKREVVLVHQEMVLEGLQKALEQLFAPSRYSFPLSQGMSTSMTMAMSMARTGKDPLLHTIDSNSIITAATTNGTVDDKNDMDPIKGVNIKMEPSLPTSIESDGDADGDTKKRKWDYSQDVVTATTTAEEEASEGGQYTSVNEAKDNSDGSIPRYAMTFINPSDLMEETCDNEASQGQSQISNDNIDNSDNSDNNIYPSLSSSVPVTSSPPPVPMWNIDNDDVNELMRRSRVYSHDSRSTTTTSIRSGMRTGTTTRWSRFKKCRESDEELHTSKKSVDGGVDGSVDAVSNGTNDDNTVDAEAALSSRVLNRQDFSRMRVIGQFNLGFIVTELRGDLFILDQHACDEKYRFEALQRSTVIHQQPLLCPLVLEASAAEEMVIEDNKNAFTQNGFKLRINESSPVGRRVELLAVPFSKGVQFGREDVFELASMIANGESGSRLMLVNENISNSSSSNNTGGSCYPRLPKLVNMFASRACRSAIMIGTGLNSHEMNRITSQMSNVDQPWNCPHGRPTMRHIADLAGLKNKKSSLS
eukprot:gene2270-4419_t